MPDDFLLRAALGCAVPLWQHTWRERFETWTPDMIAKRREALADIVASQGDVIQFRERGKSGPAFNGLAEALALMSYVPGGVQFLGDHWVGDPAAWRDSLEIELSILILGVCGTCRRPFLDEKRTEYRDGKFFHAGC